MRTVSEAIAVALAADNTQPLHLVELGFASSTVRYCGFGTVPWRGYTWLGKGLQVRGLGDSNPVIEVFDHDASLRTLLLSDGLADQPVRIWQADATALGDGDPLLMFDGVGGAFEWAKGKAVITCSRSNARSTLCPRTRMSPETGYNYLAPKGYEFRWGDKIVQLE